MATSIGISQAYYDILQNIGGPQFLHQASNKIAADDKDKFKAW